MAIGGRKDFWSTMANSLSGQASSHNPYTTNKWDMWAQDSELERMRQKHADRLQQQMMNNYTTQFITDPGRIRVDAVADNRINIDPPITRDENEVDFDCHDTNDGALMAWKKRWLCNALRT